MTSSAHSNHLTLSQPANLSVDPSGKGKTIVENGHNTEPAIPRPPWDISESNETPVSQSLDEFETNDFALESITVHAYDWQIKDGGSSLDTTELRAWCLDQESYPYLLRIMNYPVFAHLELPKMVDGKTISWTTSNIRKVYDTVCSVLKQHRPIRQQLLQAHKFYYYQNGPTLFLRLYFNNINSMRQCKNRLSKPYNIYGIGRNVKLSLHETQIGPDRKMLTELKCGYSQWFKADGRQVTVGEKVSTLQREYIINWKTIQPLEIDCVTEPGIAVIDAEVYSENRAAFPDAWNPADDAYMVSFIYQRASRPETRQDILIIYGVSNPPDDPDHKYIFVKSEQELCYKFAELVNEFDPEIVTGYNIFGFDYPYLNNRLTRLGLKWPAMGRIKDKEATLIGNTWSSSGYGHNSIRYLDMDGRINLDMLNIVKREHKLPKYNLQTVGEHFLGVGKDDVPPEMMFDVVKLMNRLKAVLETLRDETDFPEQSEIEIMYLLKTSDSIINFIQNKQQQKEVFDSATYNELIDLVNYIMNEMNKIAKYCIKDSVLVLQLFFKLNVWIYLIQLSNIAGVTPLQLFTRGQQIRGLSLTYDLAARSGYVIDSRDYTDMSWSGGFVWEPIPGLWDWVICLDFKSLYPNIIRAYNICWTTLVPEWSSVPNECCHLFEWDEPIDKDDYLEEEDENDITSDESTSVKKGKKINAELGNVEIRMENGKEERYIHYFFRFLKRDHPGCKHPNIHKEGVLPQQAKMLIDQRNKIRADMKHEKDPTKKMIMEQRQLGMKVTANSLFGLLGAGQKGRLPLLEGAMCITAKGRELIKFANDYLVNKYNAKVIYNDTDSTMVQMPGIDNGIDCLKQGKELEIELSAQFPDPLYLELEKVGSQLTIKKKNYIFWMVKSDGTFPYDTNGNPQYMCKGIPLARGDKSKWQREIVRKALDMIVTKATHREFLDMIVEYVIRTLKGEMDWKKFSIIRGLGSGYKNKSYFMKIFADQLRLIGKPARPGDRLEYLIVKLPTDAQKKSLLGYKMRLISTYLESQESDQPEEIDYHYYVNNLLMDCVDNYWKIGYKPIIDKMEMDNLIEDKWKILNELKETGFGNWVEAALANNDNDPIRAADALLHKDCQISKKAIMARRKHVSGQKIFDCRINNEPIKTLLKGYKQGRLEEVVKSFATPELFNRLYPNSVWSDTLTLQISSNDYQVAN